MQPLTAVVLGATGLIGEQLVQQLLSDPAFSKVRILVRRPVQLSHPKLDVQAVNFDDLEDYRNKLGKGDCIFCCIGTTNKKVKGDKAAYRKIDLDIPVYAAKMAKDAGFNSYLLVSAVSSNPSSANFYVQLKGEVEKEIEAVNIKKLDVFRPSVLLGNRKEFRLAEVIGKVVMKALSVVLVGGLKRFRAIDASVVAKAMVVAAKDAGKGVFVHQYEDMVRAADQR